MKLKDKVLRKEWIVACKAEEVMDEPKKVVIMGESVVQYRTEVQWSQDRGFGMNVEVTDNEY